MQVYLFNKSVPVEESNKHPTEISDTLVREWEEVKGNDDMFVDTLERLIEVHDDKYEFPYLPAEDRTRRAEFLFSEEIDRLREEDFMYQKQMEDKEYQDRLYEQAMRDEYER